MPSTSLPRVADPRPVSSGAQLVLVSFGLALLVPGVALGTLIVLARHFPSLENFSPIVVYEWLRAVLLIGAPLGLRRFERHERRLRRTKKRPDEVTFSWSFGATCLFVAVAWGIALGSLAEGGSWGLASTLRALLPLVEGASTIAIGLRLARLPAAFHTWHSADLARAAIALTLAQGLLGATIGSASGSLGPTLHLFAALARWLTLLGSLWLVRRRELDLARAARVPSVFA